MATPYSDPNLYFRLAPVQTVNWDLAFKALEYKQGQYDTNKLRVDTMLQNYLSTDIIKPEAKQRFVDNIQNLVNEINATGRTDFSDKNITNRVMAHIGQALDAPTVSAIAASKQYRQQEAFLKELLSKKPDLYHKNNHEDMYRAKGPGNTGSFYDWLYDGDATSTYSGTLQYTPYIDLDKKGNDIVMQMMKLNKDTVIELPDGTGRTKKVKISGLTREELRGIAENMFSQEDLQQLAINQRAAYGWFETPESIQLLKENAQNYYQSRIETQDAKLAELQLKLQQANPGTSNYQEIEREIEVYTDAKNNTIRTLEDLNTTKSIEQLGNHATRLGAEQFTQRLVDKYSPMYREITVGYGVDEYYFKSEELDLKRQKLEIERRKLGEQAALEDSSIGVIPIPTDTLDELAMESEVIGRLDKQREVVQENSIAYLQNLEDILANPSDFTGQQVEEADNISKLYLFNLREEASKLGVNVDFSKPLSEIAKEIDPKGQVLYGVVTSAGGLQLTTGVNRKDENIILDFITSVDQYIVGYEELSELEKQARESLYDGDQTPLLQEISSGQYQFFTEDGRALNLKQELIKEGILDANGNPVAEAKLSNSKWAKDIERTFLAGELIRSNPSVVGINNNFARTAKNLESIEALAKSFQENAEDIITESSLVSQMVGSTDNPILIGATIALTDKFNLAGTARTFKVDPNSKTGQYLLNAEKNYQDRTWVGAWTGSPKKSLAGDGRFSSLFYGNKDYRDTEIYKQGIEKIYGNLETSREVYITSNHPLMKDGRFRSLLESKEVKMDTGDDTQVYLRKINDNEIEVFQTQKTGSGKDATTERVSFGIFNTYEIASAAPQVMEQLNMEVEQPHYTFERVGNAVQKTTSDINFWNDEVSAQTVWKITSRLGSPEDEYKIKSQTAVRAMLSPEIDNHLYTAISSMVTMGIDSELVTRLPQVLENSDKFQIEARLQPNNIGGYYTEVSLVDKATNSTVYKTELPTEQNLDKVKFKLNHVPQVLFYDIVTSIIKDNYRQAMDPVFIGNNKDFATPAYKKVIKLQ